MRENQIRIGFIGGGNMAQAIIKGLLAAGHQPGCLMAADPSTDQQQKLREISADIHLGTDNSELAETCDILVLAVKPQIMASVAGNLETVDRPTDQLVISVAAGITLASLQSWLGNSPRIVRVMPNTPALIGAGISGLHAHQDLDSIARGWANYVMEATGDAIWVNDEALIDTVTAVSGSGPAYFFLIMEIMQEVAVELGLEPAQAELLATRTAAGAGLLATQSDQTAASLRQQVTSAGGTTAAALKALEEGGIRDIFRTAMTAARDRAVELGRDA